MKILVTGATGAVGPVVVDSLLAEGIQVRVLSRSGVPLRNVEVMQGDITDAGSVDRAVAGTDGVVHLAGMLHQTRITPPIRSAYQEVNVGGTAHLMRAALAHSIPRFIFASTIAVYGYNRGELLTEDTPLAPDTDYARSKAEAESIVRAAGGTVLRFGAVYGGRVRGNYQSLVRSLQRRRFVPIGDGSNRRTLLHDKDAAAAIIAVLRAPRSRYGTYNVAHKNTPTVREIVAAICVALERRPPRFAVPEAAIRVPIAALDFIARTTSLRTPITQMMLDKYLEDVVVSSQKISNELAFEARHDIEFGWAEAIAEMRHGGLI